MNDTTYTPVTHVPFGGEIFDTITTLARRPIPTATTSFPPRPCLPIPCSFRGFLSNLRSARWLEDPHSCEIHLFFLLLCGLVDFGFEIPLAAGNMERKNQRA